MSAPQWQAAPPATLLSILALLAGWLPLLLAGLALRLRIRPARLLLGAALASFVGGMCCAELRRHGLLALPEDAMLLAGNGLALHEMVRFALLGAAGALWGEALLDWPDRHGRP